MRTTHTIVEVLYHAICIGFISVMCFTLATFRPIEPNVVIAGIEIVIGLLAVAYGGVALASIIMGKGGKL